MRQVTTEEGLTTVITMLLWTRQIVTTPTHVQARGSTFWPLIATSNTAWPNYILAVIVCQSQSRENNAGHAKIVLSDSNCIAQLLLSHILVVKFRFYNGFGLYLSSGNDMFQRVFDVCNDGEDNKLDSITMCPGLTCANLNCHIVIQNTARNQVALISLQSSVAPYSPL